MLKVGVEPSGDASGGFDFEVRRLEGKAELKASQGRDPRLAQAYQEDRATAGPMTLTVASIWAWDTMGSQPANHPPASEFLNVRTIDPPD